MGSGIVDVFNFYVFALSHDTLCFWTLICDVLICHSETCIRRPVPGCGCLCLYFRVKLKKFGREEN